MSLPHWKHLDSRFETIGRKEAGKAGKAAFDAAWAGFPLPGALVVAFGMAMGACWPVENISSTVSPLPR